MELTQEELAIAILSLRSYRSFLETIPYQAEATVTLLDINFGIKVEVEDVSNRIKALTEKMESQEVKSRP